MQEGSMILRASASPGNLLKCKFLGLIQQLLNLRFWQWGSVICALINPPGIWCILKFERRRQWHPTPALLPGKSHGRRSLEGYSPWDRWGSDMTERRHFHFSLSCIGEGNGNPLQCSCLENLRDRGAWWAAVYGVAQSRTPLKILSSSSSSNTNTRDRKYLI